MSNPLRNSWNNMRQRCLNPNHPRYKDWGGRGITVDPTWFDFNTFAKDMGERPKGFTLDREDNELGYSKENCRWANNSTQSLNSRTRIDNLLGERNISPAGNNSYRVNFYRGGSRFVSRSLKLEDAIELRNFVKELLV